MKIIGKSVFQLVYAKQASLVLLNKMYHDKNVPSLKRKRYKIEKAISIIGV
jgi:hypothetical protein